MRRHRPTGGRLCVRACEDASSSPFEHRQFQDMRAHHHHPSKPSSTRRLVVAVGRLLYQFHGPADREQVSGIRTGGKVLQSPAKEGVTGKCSRTLGSASKQEQATSNRTTCSAATSCGCDFRLAGRQGRNSQLADHRRLRSNDSQLTALQSVVAQASRTGCPRFVYKFRTDKCAIGRVGSLSDGSMSR